jgi:SnoaL-like protein
VSLDTEPARAANTVSADVYAEVQNFYARHMHMLDSGDAAGWAATFTPDGSFAPPSLPEPVVGRAALEAGVRNAAENLAAKGETHRHLMSMVEVEQRADGVLDVVSYTQVVVTPHGGQTRLDLMCVCHDELVRADGHLFVHRRRVTRDDRA